MLIAQVLTDLFPPGDVAQIYRTSIHPLEPMAFIEMILLPEVAVRLIAEDMSISIGEAMHTLRISVAYGTEMFPESDTAGGASDKLWQNVARKRRMQIEEEEGGQSELTDLQAITANDLGLRRSRRSNKGKIPARPDLSPHRARNTNPHGKKRRRT